MNQPHPQTPDLEAVFADRFKTYFTRTAPLQATSHLGEGAEVEFRVQETGDKAKEVFCLLKHNKVNEVRPGPGDAPHIVMTFTPQAAVEILANPSENVGEIGIQFASLIASQDPKRKISIQFKAGFLTLLSKGFIGVLSSGGKVFAHHLTTRGLSGMGALKTLISKFKKE